MTGRSSSPPALTDAQVRIYGVKNQPAPDDLGRNRPDPAEQAFLANGVGKIIRELREAAGYSRRVLAKRAALHPGTLVKIEYGQRRPTTMSLRAIARGLDPDHEQGLWERLVQASGHSIREPSDGSAAHYRRMAEEALRRGEFAQPSSVQRCIDEHRRANAMEAALRQEVTDLDLGLIDPDDFHDYLAERREEIRQIRQAAGQMVIKVGGYTRHIPDALTPHTQPVSPLVSDTSPVMETSDPTLEGNQQGTGRSSAPNKEGTDQ
jgi:transcriptional regulator with XRE-family HTH domain